MATDSAAAREAILKRIVDLAPQSSSQNIAHLAQAWAYLSGIATPAETPVIDVAIG
jgi:hypothetical protein